MSLNRLFLFGLLISLLVGLTTCAAQDKDISGVVNAIDHSLNPLETLDPDDGFNDLDFLKAGLSDKEVVALGEVTHGTHEVYQYKDRLVRFLVSELDFRSITFESDYFAVAYLDKFINCEVDSLKLVGGGFPLKAEYRKMFTWLRSYNSNRPIADRVHVYGLEARGVYGVITSILEEFQHLSPEDRGMLKKFTTIPLLEIAKKDLKTLKEQIPRFTNLLNKEDDRYEIQAHYLVLLDQFIDWYLSDSFGLRDLYMAKNMEWVQKHSQSNKVILSAHNGHVAKTPLYRKWKPLGAYLQEEFGPAYYVIATDFNEGSVGFQRIEDGRPAYYSHHYPEVTSSKSWEFYFHRVTPRNFIIELTSAAKDPVLKRFFESKKNMRLIGGEPKPYETRLSLIENFDAVVYFDKAVAN